MNYEEKIYPLKLFNDKVDELDQSGFIESWENNGLNYNFNFIENKVNQQIPKKDQTKSFILTLRFFIQNNEPCSVANLKQHYGKLNLPDNIVNDFNNIRNILNKDLNSESYFKPKDKPKYTWRKIFNFHIFGNFAHSTQRKGYEQLNKSKFIGSYSNYYFLKVLYGFYLALTEMKNVNKRAINCISAS